MSAPNPVGRPPKDRLLPLTEVLQIVPASRAHLYDQMKSGAFPLPVKVGRSSFWRLNEIDRWMANLRSSK